MNLSDSGGTSRKGTIIMGDGETHYLELRPKNPKMVINNFSHKFDKSVTCNIDVIPKNVEPVYPDKAERKYPTFIVHMSEDIGVKIKADGSEIKQPDETYYNIYRLQHVLWTSDPYMGKPSVTIDPFDLISPHETKQICFSSSGPGYKQTYSGYKDVIAELIGFDYVTYLPYPFSRMLDGFHEYHCVEYNAEHAYYAANSHRYNPYYIENSKNFFQEGNYGQPPNTIGECSESATWNGDWIGFKVTKSDKYSYIYYKDFNKMPYAFKYNRFMTIIKYSIFNHNNGYYVPSDNTELQFGGRVDAGSETITYNRINGSTQTIIIDIQYEGRMCSKDYDITKEKYLSTGGRDSEYVPQPVGKYIINHHYTLVSALGRGQSSATLL